MYLVSRAGNHAEHAAVERGVGGGGLEAAPLGEGRGAERRPLRQGDPGQEERRPPGVALRRQAGRGGKLKLTAWETDTVTIGD